MPGLQLDPSSGLPLDPGTLQQIQQDQMMKQVMAQGGTAPERQNTATMLQAANSLFPNQQMRTATSVQDALRNSAVTQNKGESDLDFSLRQLQAQRDAVAPFDPQAAASMNTELLKRGEMKFQQDRLRASDQRQQADFDAGAGRRAFENATGGYGYLVKTTPDGEMVSTKVFDASKPAEAQAMQDAVAKDPSLKILGAKDMGQLVRSQDSAQRKLAQAVLLEQYKQKAGMIPDETVPQFALDAIMDPTLKSRASTAAKAQLENFYTQAGIGTDVQNSLRTEYKGMMAAVGNATKREANMRTFTNELSQAQGVLLDTLSKVDRSSAAKVNMLMSKGLSGWADSGPEAAYAGALQTYVSIYARVIGNGMGVVSDNARAEALKAIGGGYMGPDAMKSVLNVLSNKEAAIVNSASDSTVEMFTNPANYKNLLRVLDSVRKQGYSIAGTATQDSDKDMRSMPSGKINLTQGGAAPPADPLGIR